MNIIRVSSTVNRGTRVARRLLGSLDRSVREVVEHVSPEGRCGRLSFVGASVSMAPWSLGVVVPEP